jgi:serine/threonine-protein kinase
MALSAGTRLGPYEILSPLGAGGMGEVYRATDSNLKRQVAIKVLPASVAVDADRLARFQREAEVLAALNHPSIAAIYGFERSSDQTALVMELVEGEDLSQRIARGAIPIDEALPIAKQIAEALEAAHEQGIIHRDLKPANIKVRADGTVKVLDFGLAKAIEPTGVSSSSATLSPTVTFAGATQAGLILGTAAYMAPEQARGKAVDRRADIWAFGCVMYEMLTGRRAFEGEEISDVLARIIEREPNFNVLPAATPAAIRRLLRRCLEKNRKRRLPDIAVARLEIDDAASPGIDGMATGALHATVPVVGWRRALPWAAAGGLAAALAIVILRWAPWRTPAPLAPIRIEATVGIDASLVVDQGPAAVISPDGRLLVFVTQSGNGASQLYVRRLEQLHGAPLSGTSNARDPFFSPDSQWIGFFADGKLKKIAITGGAAVALCDAPNGRGGWWGDDGTIVFQPNTGATLGSVVQQIPDGGGKPEPATAISEGEVAQRWPQLLPRGHGILYTASTTQGSYGDALIAVQPRERGPRKVLVRGGYFGRYLASGHLVYLHDDTLFAAPFDLDRAELVGPFVPVLEHVSGSMLAGAGGGSGQLAVSETGTAVYFAGGVTSNTIPITWLDRAGNRTPLRSTPSDWSNPRFSPDGRRLAVDIYDERQSDVWIYDWSRDAATRLTLEPGSHLRPEWTPDGRRVVYSWLQPGSGATNFNLFWRRADGTGDAQRLTSSANSQTPGSWHPSGKFLAFTQFAPTTSNDLMLLAMDGDESSGWKPGKVTPLLVTPAREWNPAFSPDGRWLAYVSDETGSAEVYVRSYPAMSGKWLVSTGGGSSVVWSQTSKELVYNAPDLRLMAVSYNASADSFVPDKPRPWSETRYAPRPRGVASVAGKPFDLHPDGERVAIAPSTENPSVASDKLVFVFNFFDELRRLAPAKK